MANVNSPNGFSPVRNLDGSPWNGATTTYWIASTDTNPYYPGDPVLPLAGSDANGVPAAVRASTGTSLTILGHVVSVTPVTQSDLPYAPATKTRDYYIEVADYKDCVLECTDDGITTANLVSTAVGKNVGVTVSNPSGISPLSAAVLTSSTIGTTSTLPYKIVGLKNNGVNTAGAYARWLVIVNTHAFNGSTAGV